MNFSTFPPQKKQSLVNKAFRFVESLPPSDKLLLKLSLFVFFVSLIFTGLALNEKYLVMMPQNGGGFVEGIVGTPRFVNPLLAVTPADKDISALVYSGLMKLGPDGVLVNDMADSITVSGDGLAYHVTLKPNLTFHDGTPVTSDDVIFTVSRLEDPAMKSPLQGTWDGVKLDRVSDHELTMTLQKAYAPFLENLTVGILPKHIWEDASPDAFPFSQYNTEPVGSGPYKISKINRSKSGIPDSYVLVPFTGYIGGTPKISSIKLAFYSNETALTDDFKKGLIVATAGLSAHGMEALGDISQTHTVLKAPLPRTFAVFFNQNEAPLFRDKVVRQVLSLLTDRAPIVQDVLKGYAYPLDGPVPPSSDSTSTTPSPTDTTQDQARQMLRDDGWKFDEGAHRWKKKLNDVDTVLAFHLDTANTDLLEGTAALLKKQWESIGIAVEIKKFEQVDLTQSVIRPRKYDALLFGTVIGRELDFYPFWHSSQRNDPGLNVALYANITTDGLLVDTRTTTSTDARAKKNELFTRALADDVPAIFLYAPAFTYVIPNTVTEVSMKGIAEPYERFATIERWYMNTESVWPFFKK